VASPTTPGIRTTTTGRTGSAPKRSDLSRDRVVAAALALLDREGLEALSMRRLADELGVGTMSLYHYVADKEDLAKAIIEVVLGECYQPQPGEPWTDIARAVASGFRASALAHPAAIKLLFRGGRASSATARWAVVQKELLAGGTTPEEIRRVLRTISRFVLGWCMAEIFDSADQSIEWRRQDGDRDFSYALDVIVEGLQNRLT
jgi:AcrR family transcriptional regulator